MGEEKSPSKRLRMGFGDEKMKEDGSRKWKSLGEGLDGAAMRDERKRRG